MITIYEVVIKRSGKEPAVVIAGTSNFIEAMGIAAKLLSECGDEGDEVVLRGVRKKVEVFKLQTLIDDAKRRMGRAVYRKGVLKLVK